MIIYVDIDETICTTYDVNNPNDYSNAVPLPDYINKINKLYDNGNTIVYWTARGSRSGINWFTTTLQQLNNWGCKFHELRLGKPNYDLFIEDKSKRIEEI